MKYMLSAIVHAIILPIHDTKYQSITEQQQKRKGAFLWVFFRGGFRLDIQAAADASDEGDEEYELKPEDAGAVDDEATLEEEERRAREAGGEEGDAGAEVGRCPSCVGFPSVYVCVYFPSDFVCVFFVLVGMFVCVLVGACEWF